MKELEYQRYLRNEKSLEDDIRRRDLMSEHERFKELWSAGNRATEFDD